ncbi:MAG: TetR/AcrR family transcriptional regulator [Mogibacterium sp.]|nr:TetR/AcrR family transcriptional regulator [Mogibacterium sp.]
MNSNSDLRVRILDEASRQFNKKGIKFTMDDLARSLGMSKKTIYTVFEDKRSIMTETIDRFFDDALIEEEMILNDDRLTIVEQLKAIIGNVPERYTQNDIAQLYVLKEKYPSVYRHWQRCRENYWEGVGLLVNRGIEQGEIRPVSLPILKTMFQSTIEQFFQDDVLIKNHISYRKALYEVATILVDGIIAKRPAVSE